MNCIGLIIYMHCFAPGAVAISDFCAEAKTLLERPQYRISRSDSEGAKDLRAALQERYNRHCKEKAPVK
jgi:aspartate/methionine/tyrosine aminotransferase